MSYQLLPLTDNEIDSWNSFVAGFKGDYTIAHNPCLSDMLNRTYNMKPHNFLIYKDGRVVGIFPSCIVKGNIVSLPHFSYGGVLSQEPSDIYEYVLAQLGRGFEIRSFCRLTKWYNDDKVASHLVLKNSAEEQMGFFRSKLRSQIRKAVKHGLRVETGGTELLGDFYRVYTENMHFLGSPVLGFDFFHNIVRRYKYGNAQVFCIYLDELPIGGAIYLSYHGFSEVCWASTLRKFNPLSPNMLLYWRMIKFSIEQGMDIFSFGRSTVNSPAHRFKQQWGASDRKLYFNYSEKRSINIKKVEFLRRIWKKIPISIANKLGPFVAGRIY